MNYGWMQYNTMNIWTNYRWIVDENKGNLDEGHIVWDSIKVV